MLKEEVKKIIDRMPNDCSIEDIQYMLYVRRKVENGLRDIRNGNLISQKEMEIAMEKGLGKIN